MNFDKRAGAVIYESVPGSTLAQVLKGQGSLELAASLVLLDDCAAGLGALHNDGVLHRNVTPDAVVIETTGAVLLRDAGLWIFERANGSVPDQHAYLAPEVVRGAEYSSSADLYAVTAVFIESIGGRASKTGVRADLRSLVSAGMAADPSARSASITDFRHALDDYARATVGEAWRREGRALLIAAASAQATRTIRISPASDDGRDGVGAAKATVALLHGEPPVNTRWLLALAVIACIALLGAAFAARMTGSQGRSLGGITPSVGSPFLPFPGISGLGGPVASPTPANPGSAASAPATPTPGFPLLPSTPGANPTSNPTPGPTPPPNPALSSQTVTITSAIPSAATYGGSYTASATGGASGNPVVFSAGSSPGCTKSGSNSFAFTGVGTCTIYASQAGNARYNPGQTSQSFGVGQASQAIVYGPYPSSPTFGGGFTVTASAAGGLVTFALDSQSTSCTLSSGAVAFTSVGPCIIDANQGGDADYSAAPMRQLQLDVGQAPQSITTPFSFSPAISCPCIGQSYAVSATGGGSGNPVTFTLVSGVGVCTLVGNTITVITPGDCTIQANQAGNADYSDAPPVQQTITVS
jgi:serine/threonine protein kinase